MLYDFFLNFWLMSVLVSVILSSVMFDIIAFLHIFSGVLQILSLELWSVLLCIFVSWLNVPLER